jgi:hypothetical protein
MPKWRERNVTNFLVSYLKHPREYATKISHFNFGVPKKMPLFQFEMLLLIPRICLGRRPIVENVYHTYN